MTQKEELNMSYYLGCGLIVMGVLTYAVGFCASIYVYVKGPKPQDRALPGGADLAEVLDKLADVLDKFGSLTVPIQWALLGLLNIGVGTYLLTHPF
jgi:hypothetical protein